MQVKKEKEQQEEEEQQQEQEEQEQEDKKDDNDADYTEDEPEEQPKRARRFNHVKENLEECSLQAWCGWRRAVSCTQNKRKRGRQAPSRGN
jgi:hypothetical protein